MADLNDLNGAQFEDDSGTVWEVTKTNAGGEPSVVLEGQNKGFVGMAQSKSVRMLRANLKNNEYEIVADPNGVLTEGD